MTFRITSYLLFCFCAFFSNAYATDNDQTRTLQTSTGFVRFSFDNNVQMPNDIPAMGLLSLDYFADITPSIYAGFGGNGSLTGTQGGLFTVGVGGGLHREIIPHWWGDIGMFVGGGGGKASLTGGGLMIQPHAGVQYGFPWGRVGAYYSYISFPSGEIHSQQLGVNLDLPLEISYLNPHDSQVGTLVDLDDIQVSLNKFISFQHNDFALLVQGYYQRPGTLNVINQVQDSTMGLVGAELDHYISDNLFWWFKTSGAFSGIPNGYMDVLGGLGYHLPLIGNLSLVPQFGLGAGGGGLVETGGGFLVNPLLGLEWGVIPSLSLRVSSGYIWAPDGELSVVPVTGELIFHLDIAAESLKPVQLLPNSYSIQGWRFQFLNQTYFNPQRTFDDTTTPIEMIGVQIDQLFNPWFFMSYQAAGAYSGYHAGGYATGMIGPGLQTPTYFNHLQFFTEVLVGAGGGGGLALSGGSIIEPLAGVRYSFTPCIGVQASGGILKALNDDLNTPILNVGLTLRFDTLNQQNRTLKVGNANE